MPLPSRRRPSSPRWQAGSLPLLPTSNQASRPIGTMGHRSREERQAPLSAKRQAGRQAAVGEWRQAAFLKGSRAGLSSSSSRASISSSTSSSTSSARRGRAGQGLRRSHRSSLGAPLCHFKRSRPCSGRAALAQGLLVLHSQGLLVACPCSSSSRGTRGGRTMRRLSGVPRSPLVARGGLHSSRHSGSRRSKLCRCSR